jgi:hypothetical protein
MYDTIPNEPSLAKRFRIFWFTSSGGVVVGLSPYTVKKGLPFSRPQPGCHLSLDGNNLIITAQGEFGQ